MAAGEGMCASAMMQRDCVVASTDACVCVCPADIFLSFFLNVCVCVCVCELWLPLGVISFLQSILGRCFIASV